MFILVNTLFNQLSNLNIKQTNVILFYILINITLKTKEKWL